MKVETRQLGKIYYQQKRKVHALKNASIEVFPGETVGLWGPSGSGKSTLAKLLCGLDVPTSGTVLFDDQPVVYPFRRIMYDRVQIIFQHPEVSFNPRLTLETSLLEPYRCHRIAVNQAQLLSSMKPFGLYEEHLHRYPAELSGGELQRAAIVRALVLKPEFMILDEPTSMLDSISQAQMMHLFVDIQSRMGTSFLLISHVRALVETFCHRVYQVQDGDVFEIEKNQEIYL